MRYRDAFAYVFRHPRWLINLLLVSLVLLVPVLGGIVVFGYLAVLMESLRASRDATQYHLLDFDRLREYLLRGLRLLLASFAAALAMLPAYFLSLPLFLLVPILARRADAGGGGGAAAALGCVATAAGFAVMLALMLVVLVVMQPLLLRAALHPELVAPYSWSYIRDFVKKMWRETLLCYLVVFVVSIPLAVGGVLLLVVGVILVAGYLQLVQAHLWAQLADLYELRGGESIAGIGSEMPTPPPLPG